MAYDLSRYLYVDGLFAILEFTVGIQQREDHHPEGDVYAHSLQSVAHALRETNDTDLIVAALMHDCGKAIEKDNHEGWSARLVEPYVSYKTIWLIENHMRVRRLLDGTIKRTGKVLNLMGHPWLPDLVWLMRFDRLGREPGKVLLTKEQVRAALGRAISAHFKYNQSRKWKEIENAK